MANTLNPRMKIVNVLDSRIDWRKYTFCKPNLLVEMIGENSKRPRYRDNARPNAETLLACNVYV